MDEVTLGEFLSWLQQHAGKGLDPSLETRWGEQAVYVSHELSQLRPSYVGPLPSLYSADDNRNPQHVVCVKDT